MKKIIIVFAILFFIPAVSLAAAAVPGEMPKVEPLFPMPAEVTPNYSGNVQSSVKGAEGPEGSRRAEPEAGQNTETGSPGETLGAMPGSAGNVGNGQPNNSAVSQAGTATSSGRGVLVIIIIVLIGAGAAGWLLKGSNEEK